MRNLVLLMLGRNAEALAVARRDGPAAAAPILEMYVTALHQLLRNERSESLISIRKLSNMATRRAASTSRATSRTWAIATGRSSCCSSS